MDPWSTQQWWYHNARHQQAQQAAQQQAHIQAQAQAAAQAYYTQQAPPVMQAPAWAVHAQPPPQMVPANPYQLSHAANPVPGTDPRKLVHGMYSKRYPELHPMLASDTSTVNWDVRMSPEQLEAPLLRAGQTVVMSRNPTESIRFVCKDFPWSIVIQNMMRSTGSPPTALDAWMSIYEALSQEVAESEWGMLMMTGDKKKKEAIEKAAQRRREAHPSGSSERKSKVIRRVDWLADKTIFKGLEHDDAFTSVFVAPWAAEVEETWVIKMGTS